MFKKKIRILLSSTILVTSLMVGCAPSSSNDTQEKISISGSTSVGPVVEILGEDFKKKDSDVSIEVQQLGSSAGIKNAIEGTSQIGMASRDLKNQEKDAGLKETPIALDAIALVTNKSNEVNNLTMQQIKDIYTGKITNWKEVGGKYAPIVVVSREDGSGTRGAFEEIVGFNAGELIKDAQISDGSGNIKVTVQGNENAIGYISSSYADESINKLKVENQELTVNNVKEKKYPLARPFLLVNKENSMTSKSNEFLEFILSDEGQKIVEGEGLISIR